MRVAIITPTQGMRRAWLQQCHDSVRAQTHPCTHIVVSDGGGAHGLQGFEGQFMELSQRHDDCGDTPRSLGALSAFAQRFDAVCWLDDDNWYYPDHVARLVALHQTSGAPVCLAVRDIYHRVDDRLLGAEPAKQPNEFRDANCYFMTRRVEALAGLWSRMPREWHIAGDVYFWGQLFHRGVPTAHLETPTVAYRANSTRAYRQFGVEPPPGVRDTEALWQTLREQGLALSTPAPEL